MINKKPLKQFEEFADGRLVKPIYKDYSFANLPATIYYLLTAKKSGVVLPADCFGGTYPRPRKVVLFLIDSFGFFFWQKYQRQFSWLAKITDQGVVTPVSALFPSTTASSVTTIHFGVLPSQHALFEWNLYIPEYGEVIQTLPFSPLGGETQDGCLELGYDPNALFASKRTFFQQLAEVGVKSVEFASSSFARGAGNQIAGQGAEIVPVKTLAEGLAGLAEKVKKADNRTFFYFYWGDIDAISHRYGPGSTQLDAEIANFWLTFAHVFANYRQDKETLFLFTADHGQIKGSPEEAYYLNGQIPEMMEWLKLSPKGEIIYPTGSPRDVFLHLKPGKVDQAHRLLKEKLKDIAWVMLVKEAKEQGFFGPLPFHPEFEKRLGEILILPYGGRYVWWYEEGKLRAKHQGSHGGLTKEEMVTVFTVF